MNCFECGAISTITCGYCQIAICAQCFLQYYIVNNQTSTQYLPQCLLCDTQFNTRPLLHILFKSLSWHFSDIPIEFHPLNLSKTLDEKEKEVNKKLRLTAQCTSVAIEELHTKIKVLDKQIKAVTKQLSAATYASNELNTEIDKLSQASRSHSINGGIIVALIFFSGILFLENLFSTVINFFHP